MWWNCLDVMFTIPILAWIQYDEESCYMLNSKMLLPCEDYSMKCFCQALMSCHVTALQDQLVSWFYIAVPEMALTLLTVGFQTYSHDTRYSLDFQLPNNYRQLSIFYSFEGNSTRWRSCCLQRSCLNLSLIWSVTAGWECPRLSWVTRGSTIVSWPLTLLS